MTNHIRTLLLNETQASLAAAGFSYGVPWYVSPSFESLNMSSSLDRFRSALFYDTFSLDDRIKRVDVLMLFVKSPDLSKFFSMMDTRETVGVSSSSSKSVRELFDSGKNSSNGFEEFVLSSIGASSSIFSKTGTNSVDVGIRELKDLAMGSFEAPIRIGAAVIAYCLQLDSIRLRGPNGQ